MNTYLISVIIVVYNGENTIAEAIESVICQTYKRVELVVIDGGSSDGTVQIVRSFGNKVGFFDSKKDKGIYDAMNKGIASAKGDWLYFLGADDLLVNKDILLELFGNYLDDGTAFLYGNVRFRSGNAIYGGSRTYSELMVKNICHQAIFYHKSIFESLSGFNLRYPVLADYDLNLRIFEQQGIKKKYVDKDICIYNNRGGVSSITIDALFFNDRLHRYLKEGNFSSKSPELQRFYFFSGIAALFAGKKTKQGVGMLAHAFSVGNRKLFYFFFFLKLIIYKLLGKKIRVAGY